MLAVLAMVWVLLAVVVALANCGDDDPYPQVVVKEVIKEVPVERTVIVEKEVIVEKPVTKGDFTVVSTRPGTQNPTDIPRPTSTRSSASDSDHVFSHVPRPTTRPSCTPTPSPTDTFGVGSTKNQVSAAQGAPTLIVNSSYGGRWIYCSSQVHFDENDRVEGWQDPAGVLRLTPSTIDTFVIGSTKDEVRQVQGTPTFILGPGAPGSWFYGSSRVNFDKNPAGSKDGKTRPGF